MVMKSTIFRDITPCSPLKVNRRVGGSNKSRKIPAWKIGLPPAFTLVSCSTVSSSETSVDFQRTTGRYIPEDRTLQSMNCFSCLHSKRNFTTSQSREKRTLVPLEVKLLRTAYWLFLTLLTPRLSRQTYPVCVLFSLEKKRVNSSPDVAV
jgi:hypothetical protein